MNYEVLCFLNVINKFELLIGEYKKIFFIDFYIEFRI